MRGLCGWFAHAPSDDDRTTLQRMLAAGGAVGTVSSTSSASTAMAGFGGTAGPRLLERDGLRLVVAGHPRLDRQGRRTSDLDEIARALREQGRPALEALEGDFALAFWDDRSERGLLAIDRIGMHQLVYARSAAGLVFASTLDMLAAHPQVPRKLSPQALYHYLYYHVCPGPATVFEGLRRIPPGHCIGFGRGADAEPRAYWTMRFVEPDRVRFDELKQEFVSLLRAAVGESAEGAACGAFLSGGTDSSTVSGMLQQAGAGPARTFSIGFAAEGYDETEYARIAARHFGFEHHEYRVTPADVVTALPKIATAYDQPFGNASAVPTYLCASFAREHGVARLLAGDGGDELFGGNARYAKQHLLGLYERVPVPLRRGAIEPLLLSAAGTKTAPLRKLRSYVEQARTPMPQRYESYNLLERLGVEQVLAPEFLASIDAGGPGRLLDEAHAPFADASLINQMLGIDLRLVLADGDLPKVTHMCNLAGVDVAFPMLDQRLVEFSCRLPSDMKLRGTQLRWFFKEALRDFLPPEIITKKKHGFGLPVGEWLLAHKPLFELAADSIALLRPHGIVRTDFVSGLLESKLREHPAYYGTMAWVLMMLGLWLDSRRP